MSSDPDRSDRTLAREQFPLFRHQVAGHFPLLWREQTIYKPCQEQEAAFYTQMRTVFPALVSYTPKCYGVVSIADSCSSSSRSDGAIKGSGARPQTPPSTPLLGATPIDNAVDAMPPPLPPFELQNTSPVLCVNTDSAALQTEPENIAQTSNAVRSTPTTPSGAKSASGLSKALAAATSTALSANSSTLVGAQTYPSTSSTPTSPSSLPATSTPGSSSLRQPTSSSSTLSAASSPIPAIGGASSTSTPIDIPSGGRSRSVSQAALPSTTAIGAASVSVMTSTSAAADPDALPADLSHGSEIFHSPSPSLSSPTLAPATMSHSHSDCQHIGDQHSDGGCLVSPNALSLLSSFDEFVDSSLMLPRRPSVASPIISCTSEEFAFPLGSGGSSADAKQVPLSPSLVDPPVSSVSATTSYEHALGTPTGTPTATSAASAAPTASTKSHKKQQSGLDGHSSSGSDWSQRLAGERRPATNQYLVLEDLTSQYKQPCVLDLKLGTRQHGLNETAEKIKSKTNKVKNSTSSSLGLRVCGMQVYHPGDKEFLFRDKYFGRSIDAGAFEKNLLDFLYNGGVDAADAPSNSEASASSPKRRGFFREDLVPLLVERLEAFKKVVGLQTQYRFYSSSLLLLYEGAVPADYDPSLSMQSIHSRVDVRFIDFAHTAPIPDEEAGLLDCGVLMGLQNLIHLLLKVYHGHARNHTRAFPLVSSLHLQPDESSAAGGAATGSASDLGTASLSSTMLPSIIVGTQRCLRRPQSLTGAHGGSASGGESAGDAAAMNLAGSSNNNSSTSGSSAQAVIEMPVWGDEPVDVMEMTVTPRGHVLAQRLRRATDYLNAHVRQLPRVLLEQPAF